MNVKSVSEKTGLTRRAIKYYEKEGLIIPKKNEENNYREYTNEDIIKLNFIAALRMLDIPIPNIKEVIQGEKNLNIIMKKTLNDIEKNIQELQKNKSIINYLLDKSIGDIYEMSSEVKNLRETLEYSTKMKKQYIYDEFMRIFPGPYGELLALIYEPFLNVRIDTEEKKSAWINMIEDLDTDSIIDENHPYLKLIEDEDMKEEIKKAIQKDHHVTIGLINRDENAIKQVKERLISYYSKVKKNDDFRKKHIENMRHLKNMKKLRGNDRDSLFDEYLKILSEDFKSYCEVIDTIRNEVESELGIEIEGFIMDILEVD